MKSFKQFISESINISGDFNGNLYFNSSPEDVKNPIGEEYVADIMWEGNLYRLEFVASEKLPTKQELGEQLQKNYPGAIVHQIYPVIEKNLNIKSAKRYHPSKLEWID